jgi:hypothetical protein
MAVCNAKKVQAEGEAPGKAKEKADPSAWKLGLGMTTGGVALAGAKQRQGQRKEAQAKGTGRSACATRELRDLR